jgi:hypothetical protein
VDDVVGETDEWRNLNEKSITIGGECILQTDRRRFDIASDDSGPEQNVALWPEGRSLLIDHFAQWLDSAPQTASVGIEIASKLRNKPAKQDHVRRAITTTKLTWSP